MKLQKRIEFLFIILSFFFFHEDLHTSNLQKIFNDKINKDDLHLNANYELQSTLESNILYPKQLADTTYQDSLAFGLIKSDSTKIDSTARIKHFKYKRKDNRFLQLDKRRETSFFVQPSQRLLSRTVELDSTGSYVIIKERIAGNEVRSPLKIPLDQYIKQKLDLVARDSWEYLGYDYTLKVGKDDLGKFLGSITNIEIPLPSVSFLSIFGPPKISLKINGAVDIHGAWRNEKTEGVTASLLGNTKNEPDFKQQVQINVNGMIGDKLTIAADWNTERTFEFENQLKLHYQGYKDEIIQSVEAGNVSLSTSSLVGGGEALFGIKALFQFGPFTLTALASQKKSEVEEVSVSGGSKSSPYQIRAYDYSTNHYFIDTVYADENLNIFGKIFGQPTPQPIAEYVIKDIEVWKTAKGRSDNSKYRRANAYIDLSYRESNDASSIAPYEESYRTTTDRNTVPGQFINNDRFVLLTESQDYTYNKDAGFISFNTQISQDEAIAVAYRIEGPVGDNDLYCGEFLREVQNDTSKVMVLKLIKPKYLQPGGDFEQAWKLQLKNIYPIGGRNINKEGFTFDIYFDEPGKEPLNTYQGESILEEFGLDKIDESGASNPDGAFDWDPGRTILTNTGEIIFPTLQPFGRDFPFDKSLAYQAIYDTTKTYAQQDKTKDRFLFKGEYSASVTSVYNIGFNVVENSVKVTLGGRTLTNGYDYKVDYSIGQVTILNQDALVSGADLKITYEKNDLFQLASKTLVGLRGIYDFNERTKLGFSFLNLNQTTLSDKVRIGEEPSSNSIFGMDFKTGFDLPFITKGLNKVISTKKMSAFSLNGEFAYMNPDPNTKKSTITGDDKESIAYIDDFEGAKTTIPISNSYVGWRDISIPDSIPGIYDLPLLEQMNYKAETYWFNMLPAQTPVVEIWGDRKKDNVTRNNDRVTVLDFVYNPKKRGTYNYNPEMTPAKNWGGMMYPLSSSARNLVEQKIEFVEFYMKIENAPKNAKLIVDLGQISEDVFPDRDYSTEDRNNNDILDEGEDTGIDGLTNTQEIQRYGDFDGTGDPSNDDFNYFPGSNDYSTINKTQGNGKLRDGSGIIPNSEDLNGNYILDNVNSYFRYEIPLDTIRATNKYISGGGNTATIDGTERKLEWYQYRIPIKEFKSKIGNPTLSLVETIRFWVAGSDEPIRLRFVEMNLVGNQWEKVLVPGSVTEKDTTLVISTINFEDNERYVKPPGLKKERDRMKTSEIVYKNEQSLLLTINDLKDGDRREIIKYLPESRKLYLFNYRKMKLFVRGEQDNQLGSISFFESLDNYASEIYFRFGTDTSNFYEYRQPLTAGKPANRGWEEIEIIFEELTAIKQKRNPDEVDSLMIFPVNSKEGHFYGIKGRPTLTNVSFFMFGILNPKDVGFPDQEISGELWLNELRVLGADDTPGWAYKFSSQMNFADLFTVSLNTSKTDPYFHKLGQRFGRRVDQSSWGGAVNFNVLKLLPWNLSNSNLSISYSHNESVSKPLYQPGTDIKVDKAVKAIYDKSIEDKKTEAEAKNISEQARLITETVNVSDVVSLSGIRFQLENKNWYVQDILNNLTFSFSYNQNYGRDPSRVFSKNWNWKGSGNYSLNLSRENYFYLSDIPLLGYLIEILDDYKNVKFYYTPQSFKTGFSANRRRSSSLSRDDSARIKTQRDFTSNRDLGFSWQLTEGGLLNLSLSYGVNVASSYTHLLTKKDSLGYTGSLWNEIINGPIFGKDYSYNQNFDIRTQPALPSIWNLRNYLSLTFGYGVNYRWANNFAEKNFGKSIGYSNNIKASMNLKWQSLTAPLFKEDKKKDKNANTFSNQRNNPRSSRRGANKTIDEEDDLDVSDKNNVESELDTVIVKGEPFYVKALSTMKSAIKWLLFDYENISTDFSQNNSASSSGITANGTGFSNFWVTGNDNTNGPSRLFMLGFGRYKGSRAPLGTLNDNFTQKNNVRISTSRPLWKGAKISLNWNVGWGFRKQTRITTDENGAIILEDVTSSGNLNRSFLYFPIFLSDAGIEKVHELYASNDGKDLTNAFLDGFESIAVLGELPILRDVVKFIPRANWRISWSGLEKISFLKNVARTISLNHSYSSTYTEGWKVDSDGNKQVQTQRVSYGFSPLLGLNISFDKLWDGNLRGSLKYSTKTNYDLSIATKNITESSTSDINFTASFSKSGFSLPMFGLDLQNDIEMSLSYTKAINSVVIFEMDKFNKKGTPQDGTTRTILEPRIKYTLSSKVNLSIFYKRTSVEPKGASRIPPTTTNEAGLDVHISVQ